MKSSDIKPWIGYPYYQRRVSPEAYSYYNFTVVVPMDTKVWHRYNDRSSGAAVYERGRKALGYGNDYWNTAGRPYIEECGVPCMVADSMTIGPSTQWKIRLIDPRLIWKRSLEPMLAERAAKQEEQRQKQEEAERRRARIEAAQATLVETIKLVCPGPIPSAEDADAVVMPYNVSRYGAVGIAFSTLTEMQWLTKFILDSIEVQEELKDLLYEMED